MSILAALRVRDHTGMGQYIDIALIETTMSMLSNVASNYLISGNEAPRLANGHPNIVPYQAFHTRDGMCVVSCGNDRLYLSLCRLLGREDLASEGEDADRLTAGADDADQFQIDRPLRVGL